jgi:hypothetical protein
MSDSHLEFGSIYLAYKQGVIDSPHRSMEKKQEEGEPGGGTV